MPIQIEKNIFIFGFRSGLFLCVLSVLYGEGLIRYCQKFYEKHGMRHERDDLEGGWEKDGRFFRERSVSVRIFSGGEGISVAEQDRSFTVL
jgi:hypothetical protein